MSKRCPNGFVLVELLVVMAILVIIAAAIFSSLAVGIKVLRVVESKSSMYDRLLGFKEMQRDLLNQVPLKKIGFVGREGEVIFPGLISLRDKGENSYQEIGRIRYYFDSSCECLCQEKLLFADWVKGVEGKCKPVMNEVLKVHFVYYGAEEASATPPAWQPEWTGTKLPLALRLNLTLTTKDEKQFTLLLPGT